MDTLESHELNFKGVASASLVDGSFHISEAFRISAGVSGRVPQALRNLAYRILFNNLGISKYIKHGHILHIYIYKHIYCLYFYRAVRLWFCVCIYASIFEQCQVFRSRKKKKLKINHNLAVTVSLESNRLNGSSNLKIDSDSDL